MPFNKQHADPSVSGGRNVYYPAKCIGGFAAQAAVAGRGSGAHNPRTIRGLVWNISAVFFFLSFLEFSDT